VPNVLLASVSIQSGECNVAATGRRFAPRLAQARQDNRELGYADDYIEIHWSEQQAERIMALIGVVTVFVIPSKPVRSFIHRRSGASLIDPIVAVAEFRGARASKTVVIFNDPPHIHEDGILLRFVGSVPRCGKHVLQNNVLRRPTFGLSSGEMTILPAPLFNGKWASLPDALILMPMNQLTLRAGRFPALIMETCPISLSP